MHSLRFLSAFLRGRSGHLFIRAAHANIQRRMWQSPPLSDNHVPRERVRAAKCRCFSRKKRESASTNTREAQIGVSAACCVCILSQKWHCEWHFNTWNYNFFSKHTQHAPYTLMGQQSFWAVKSLTRGTERRCALFAAETSNFEQLALVASKDIETFCGPLFFYSQQGYSKCTRKSKLTWQVQWVLV